MQLLLILGIAVSIGPEDVAASHLAIGSRATDAGGFIVTETRRFSGLDRSEQYMTAVNLEADTFLFEAKFAGVDTKGFRNSVESIANEYCFKLSSEPEKDLQLVRYVISDNPDANMSSLGFGTHYRRPSRNRSRGGMIVGSGVAA